MKVTAITLRPGNVVEYNDKLWVVEKYDIIQPGKGASVTQVEMRDIRSGNKDNVRFRTQETIERVRLDQDNYQYLFEDSGQYTFMNKENYEQITVSNDLIGEPAVFLQEGMDVVIETFEGEPLSVQLPSSVTMEITEADPVVKGQTASSSYKGILVTRGIAKAALPPDKCIV